MSCLHSGKNQTDLLETCAAAATDVGADGGESLVFYNEYDLPFVCLFVCLLL
jgi:hypothetical protein